MENYHNGFGSFPPAYVADAAGRPMHIWRVLLLPYMDAAPLYKQYRFDEPWDGPTNRRVAETVLPIYLCPARHESSRHALPRTNYAAG